VFGLCNDNAKFAARRELFTRNSTAGMRTDITKRFIDPRDGIFCLRASVNNTMKYQFPWQANNYSNVRPLPSVPNGPSNNG